MIKSFGYAAHGFALISLSIHREEVEDTRDSPSNVLKEPHEREPNPVSQELFVR